MKNIFIIIFTLLILLPISADDIIGKWELKTEYMQKFQVKEISIDGIAEKKILLTPVELLWGDDIEEGVNVIEFYKDYAYIYAPIVKGRIKVTYEIYKNVIQTESKKKVTIIHFVFYQNDAFVLTLNLTKVSGTEYLFTYMIQIGSLGLPLDINIRFNYIGKMVKKE